MKKKIAFVLAMLIMLTVSLSAQAVNVVKFFYEMNLSEEQFYILLEFGKQQLLKNFPTFRPTNKIPNAVIQTINNNLRSYSLDIGDCFMAAMIYQEISYAVYIRITNAINTTWQFVAYYSLQ